MKRALITAFVTALTCLCLTACGSEESSSSATPESNNAPAAEANTGGGGGGGGGDSVCGRARTCCNAYVEAMGGAAMAGQACAGIDTAEQTGGAAADASCTAMISGWRQSLSGMGREVPAACQ
jgi:hypothetical protein